jgi:hypothetical protein
MGAAKDQNENKTEYQKIISGEIEPVGAQKGWLNLQKRVPLNQMDPEKRKEICQKGAAAVNKIRGEKKTAKEALENILTLKVNDKIISAADLEPEIAERLKRSGSEVTFYDLINLVAVGRAVSGNMKAYELIRDTYGDAPIKQIEVSENITTDSDREMLRLIADRLKQTDVVIVEDQTREDGTGKDDNT